MSKTGFLVFIAAFLLPFSTLYSQNDSTANLLQNGDFEGAFVELEGAAPRNVAEHWSPWHVAADDNSPSFVNHDPNYDKETSRVRLDEAGKAQAWFTLFATHQGGLYQEVANVESGKTYRFSVYAYVWSSSYEDTEESEDPGDVVVRVGIDPDGGTDGESDDIIWSTAATFFYDAYRQYAVIATAESTDITVFIESTVGGPRANNYIYLDDAALQITSETIAATAEQTPTSETNSGLTDETATATASSAPQDTPTATLEPPPTKTAQPTPSPVSITSPPATATSEPETAGIAQEATPTNTLQPTPTPESITAPPPTATSEPETARSEQEPTPTGELDPTPTAESITELPATATEAPEPTPSPSATASATLEPSSTPTATPSATPTIPGDYAETVTHTVVTGDTVSALALQYGSTVAAINEANELNQSNLIYIGQLLVIPVNLPPTPDESGATAPPPTATPTPSPSPTSTPSPTPTPIVHQVQRGDTLEAIAQRYGTTVQLLAQINGISNVHQIDVGQVLLIPTPVPPSPTPTATYTPTPAPTVPATPSPTPDSYIIYIVQAGDTLGEIALAHGTTVSAIVNLNGLENPSRISPGDSLKIPASSAAAVVASNTPALTPTPLPTSVPITHKVQAGETLFGIALRYGVSIVELAQLNGISNYSLLSVGAVLTIPG